MLAHAETHGANGAKTVEASSFAEGRKLLERIAKGDHERIVEMYLECRNCKKISKILGYTNDTITKHVHKANLPLGTRMIDNLFPYEIEDICQKYKDKVMTSKIMESYPFIKCENTVVDIVRKRDIPIRENGRFISIIEREDFFESIEEENQAYLVGLLIADGYVIGHKHNPKKAGRTPAWGIALNYKDKYILEWIKDTVGLHTKIVRTNRNTYFINTTSKKMVDDLGKYGVVPRKSFLTYLPDNIPKEMQRHLIRGILDGDGCISNHTCSFYGNKDLLIGIRSLLKEEIGIGDKKITHRERGIGADSFSFSSRECVKKFYHYLYDDATIFMKRKYEKFLKLNCIEEDANTVVTVELKTSKEP